MFTLRGELALLPFAGYVVAQVFGGVLGVWAAHVMFDLPVWQVSTTVRSGAGQWFAEFVATFGLISTILGCLSWAKPSIPYAVGLYITAAYWFTASTSFANPAVTIARALSNTFAGIAPTGVPGFIAAQMIGAVAALALAAWLFRPAPEAANVPTPTIRAPGRH